MTANKKFPIFLFLLIMCLRINAQVTLTDTNLPIIDIKTSGASIPDEPKITADMRFIFNSSGQTRVVDSANLYYGKIGIERRGSTSQSISLKKPYSIELRDAAGNDREVSFFGWTKIEDWALIAPYSDKTLMRDALTYQLAGSFMDYAPKTRFCELLLNGQYQGVYVLTENIKRKRLGISKLDSTILTGDALTGGYIVKIDKTTGEPGGISLGFSSQQTNSNGKITNFIYDYPKPEDIKPAQVTYIKSLVREFEAVLKSDKFDSPTEGYAKYFDVQSLVDFFIMNELTRNVDGYRLSTYFYKDKNSVNSKFKMGPVWDFNIALGNADYCQGGETYGWAYKFNDVCPGDGWGIPFWWDKLMSDTIFKKKVKERWTQLRQNKLSNNTILGTVDSFSNVLSAAQNRNFRQWNILSIYVWPNKKVNGSYTGEVEYLKSWLSQRLIWLDGEISALRTSEPPKPAFDFSVFPNPTKDNGEVRFAYYLYYDAKMKLNIYNSSGQLVEQQEVTQMTGNNNLYWRDAASKGLFLYNLYLNGKLWNSGKLVKE